MGQSSRVIRPLALILVRMVVLLGCRGRIHRRCYLCLLRVLWLLWRQLWLLLCSRLGLPLGELKYWLIAGLRLGQVLGQHLLELLGRERDNGLLLGSARLRGCSLFAVQVRLAGVDDRVFVFLVRSLDFVELARHIVGLLLNFLCLFLNQLAVAAGFLRVVLFEEPFSQLLVYAIDVRNQGVPQLVELLLVVSHPLFALFVDFSVTAVRARVLVHEGVHVFA